MKRGRNSWCLGLAVAMTLGVWTAPAGAHDIGGPCKDAEAGTPCELDGNKCTREKCDGQGKCTASGPAVTCPGPVGQCDGGKVCDPGTGTCKDRPDKPEGTVCERDRNKCTPDACNDDGFCVAAGPPLACHEAVGECDNGKECDPQTGSCVDRPDKPEGTPCDRDRDKCTPDACNDNGFCIKAPPIDCSDGDVCTDDLCDKTTGECENVPDPSNDPICEGTLDLAVDKTASCACTLGDDGGSGEGVEDDVVPCEVVEDSSASGCHLSYEVSVTNNGPGGATGVRLTDLLPAALAFLSATPTQGSYDAETGLWDVGDLGSAGSAILAIEADTPSSPEGALIENCASLTAVDQGDSNAGNDSACVTVAVPGGTPACIDPLPRSLDRRMRAVTRLLKKAALARSPEFERRLLRKVDRAIARAGKGVARLQRSGALSGECAAELDARVARMGRRAQRLAP